MARGGRELVGAVALCGGVCAGVFAVGGEVVWLGGGGVWHCLCVCQQPRDFESDEPVAVFPIADDDGGGVQAADPAEKLFLTLGFWWRNILLKIAPESHQREMSGASYT